MNATKDKIENHQAYLTVQVEPDEMEKALDGAYRRLVQKARVPGFRQGKAPRAILERYIGKESLSEDAINHLVPELYEKALKEQELEAIGQPQLEVTQTDPTVIFKAVVPLSPTVKLGEYHGNDVEQPHSEVTEDQVDSVIEELRRQHATWEPVERAIAFDDLVAMDIESTIETQPFIIQKGAQFQAVKGQNYPLPGFSEQLVGLKKDEEKEFNLKLPDDFSRKEFAGKEAVIKVKIIEVKAEKLPEVDAELAKAVSPDLLTAEALREQAGKELKQRAEERDRTEFEAKLIDAVVSVSEIEFPPVMVESEINRVLNQRFQNNSQAFESYLKMMNKTEQEIREELRPSAVTGVRRALALAQLTRDAKIDVTDADIDAEIEKMREGSTSKKDDLDKFFRDAEVRNSVGQTLTTRKTFQLLKDIAQANRPAAEPKAAAEKETKEETSEKKTRKKKE